MDVFCVFFQGDLFIFFWGGGNSSWFQKLLQLNSKPDDSRPESHLAAKNHEISVPESSKKPCFGWNFGLSFEWLTSMSF